MAGLPDEVRALAEMSPVEDLLYALLRDRLPDAVRVQTLIHEHQEFPLVIARRSPSLGTWRGDTRFVDNAIVLVNCLVEDPNGDEDAAILSEAVRVILRDAWLNQTVVPGRGHISNLEMQAAPRRAPDWATSAGPVQYADLPTGVWRYEARYDITIHKPRNLLLSKH